MDRDRTYWVIVGNQAEGLVAILGPARTREYAETHYAGDNMGCHGIVIMRSRTVAGIRKLAAQCRFMK